MVSEGFSRSAKEIQIADHLFTVTYPFTGDARVLFRVMAHACNAVDEALDALGNERDEQIPSKNRALSAYEKFSKLLEGEDTSPTVFMRKRKVVIASTGFASLSEVRASDVESGLRAIKEFVFQAGKHVMVIR